MARDLARKRARRENNKPGGAMNESVGARNEEAVRVLRFSATVDIKLRRILGGNACSGIYLNVPITSRASGDQITR